VSIAKRAVEIGRAPATAYNSQPHHSQQSCSLETV
jgi:hypothetical protein